MQVRTFQGISTQEVLNRVKTEMGSDAVILSSREFQKDGERCYEVTAGRERSTQDQVIPPAQNAMSGSSGLPGIGGMGGMNTGVPTGYSDWHKEWSRFKDHMYALMQPALNWEKVSPRQKVALEYLQNEGVDDDVIFDLYQTLTDPESDGSLLVALSDIVPMVDADSDFWSQHIHLIAGPYGSGKTTTALRLASLLRESNNEAKIAFINTDSVRGNGRIVLRHFAELSGFDTFDVMDKQSFITCVKNTIDYDYVFVDIQAIPKDETLMNKLEYFGLGQIKQNIACHLCLSPCYSSDQLDHYVKQYQTDIPMGITWTKLDDSVSYGSMVNVSAHSGLPISLLSYGAELSNSLCFAEPKLVWKLLLKHELPNMQYT